MVSSLRAKLLLASAVLLAFTAVVGVLGLALERGRPTPAPSAPTSSRCRVSRHAPRSRRSAPTAAASAASARTTSQLAAGRRRCSAGSALALWFTGGIGRSLRELARARRAVERARDGELRRALEAAATGRPDGRAGAVRAARADAPPDELGESPATVGTIREQTLASVKAYNALRAPAGGDDRRAGRRRGHRRRRVAADGRHLRRGGPRGHARSPPPSARSRPAPSARSAASRPPARRSRAPRAPRQTSADVAAATVQAAGDARAVALEGVDAAISRQRGDARGRRLLLGRSARRSRS